MVQKTSKLSWIFDDIKSTYENDPALRRDRFSIFEIILYQGIYALFFYRIANILFLLSVPFLPRLLSQYARFITGIEIHPGATIGKGCFIDHGMGIVIGETAVLGDFCILFHGVTLGGTGKHIGKRHPTVGNNVILGANAILLGPINIGNNVKIGAGTIVLSDIEDGKTVVGVKGRII